MPNPDSPATAAPAAAEPAPAAAAPETAQTTSIAGTMNEAMDADAAFDAVFGKDETEAKAEDTPEAPKAPAAKDGPSVKAEEISTAIKSLRRDNVPDDLIEHLQRTDPKKLVAWGKSASKRQADVDAYSGRQSQLERKIAEYEAKMAEAGEKRGEDAGGDDDDDLRDLAEQLSPEIADRIKKIVSKTSRASKSEIAELREQLSKVTGFSENLLVEQARADLLKTGRYPELEDADFFESVKAQMSAQIRRGDYQEPKKLIRDCVLLLRGDDYREQAIKSLDSDRRVRTAAQPSVPTAREQPKGKTAEELQDEAIDMALDGKPIEDIKRHLASAHR